MAVIGKVMEHVRQGDLTQSALRYGQFRIIRVFTARLRRDWRGFPLLVKGSVSFLWHTRQRSMWRRRRKLVLQSLELDNNVVCQDNKLLDLVFQLQCDPGYAKVLMSFREMCNVYRWVRRTSHVEGDLAEVGVYRGGSAKLICEAKGKKQLHLFDTFTGLPEPDRAFDVLAAGEMRDTGVEQVKQALATYSEVHFHPGVFPQTAAAAADRTFSFVHLDMDLYRGTMAGLEFFYPRLNPGGAVLLHDYNSVDTPGVKKAVDEFFEDKPEPVIELWDSQCVVVKSGSQGSE